MQGYEEDFEEEEEEEGGSAANTTAAAPAAAAAAATADPIAAAAFKQIATAELTLGRARGGGTFASVFEATYTPAGASAGARVAVKQLADPSASAEAKATFFAELNALVAAGSHANIVALVGAVLHPRPAIVLELLGVSLAEALARGPPGAARGASWPLAAVLGWAADVAAGLAHLHARAPAPLLHRDVKPANVLLRRGGAHGVAVLADFGLCGARTPDAGTPAFLAPECWAGGASAFGRAADVFALGATLHSLLTAAEPWAGWAPADVREAVLAGRRPDAARERADAPAAVRELLAALWAQAAAARPSAADAERALRAAARDAAAAGAPRADFDALDALGARR
jgi:serine/threonine protein kinase